MNRHGIYFAVFALATFIGLVTPSGAESTTVTIDPNKNWGTWEGWGVSLCWWAKAFGDRDDVADLLFTTKMVDFNGEKLPGLGMNIARYNAGACSWNEVDGCKMAVGKNTRPSRQMEGFWLDGKSDDPQSASWDWSVDANQRAMLLKARDRGANWFELFSNSPMWWMCKNQNPSGAAKATDDNLAPEHYEKFAVYLATIAKRAKELGGLTFTTVEPFNESSSDSWQADGRQEGCHFDHETQAAILPLLRAELDKRGLKDMPIAASDESYYDQAIATWKSFDEKTKALVVQVNVHGYQGAKGGRGELFEMVSKAGKRLWNSEYGDEDGTGLTLARYLHLDFRHLHPTAWCYWQAFDMKGWGLVVTDVPNKTFQQVSPKYFVLAQYMRHIRPGMKILETGDTDTVAAYDAKGRKLVLVVRNGSEAATKTFDLSAFAVADGPVTRWITEPKGSSFYQQHKDVSLAAKCVEAALPANSIQTFEVENVTQP